VHGSRTLVRWPLDNNLVDEMTLLTFPVVVGQGRRLFLWGAEILIHHAATS
jgi:dihydrofolate reductase